MAAHNVVKSRLIAAPPAFVVAVQASLIDWLRTMPVPDFQAVADPKAEWATPADDSASGTAAGEGSAYDYLGGGTAGFGTATAFVVSAETYKRIKARRYATGFARYD